MQTPDIDGEIESEGLLDCKYVYEALLGHGMFAERIPPCFTSKQLLTVQIEPEIKSHSSMTYRGTRNTNVSRQFAVPHPEAYMQLCTSIKNYWTKINKHIGKPSPKFNFCHVRRIAGKKHIFEMNYNGRDKWKREDREHEFYLGCTYVVKADISTCFPSMYIHSLAWAIRGKECAKKNRGTTKKGGHWSNDIDRDARNCNDGQTNGLLIGPHASNILSEIILTAVDARLQKKKFTCVIRHIDDYKYFAKDEKDAREFLRQLEQALQEYALLLNPKKTKIIPLQEYFADDWPQQMARFPLQKTEKIGYTSIVRYLDYAISLADKEGDSAAITWAIKTIARQTLSNRAKRLYLTKILSISIHRPYLLPLLDEYVLKIIPPLDHKCIFEKFLNELYCSSIKMNTADGVAYALYFGLKYDPPIDEIKDVKDIVELNDCITLMLGWKYRTTNKLLSDRIETKAPDPIETKVKEIKEDERLQDQFWLFLYEYAEQSEDLPKEQQFLRQLKGQGISFFTLDVKY